jgi:type IV secretory pathway TrbL component
MEFVNLFNQVFNDNLLLQKEIDSINTTDDRKVIYEIEQKKWFQSINIYFLILYFFLVIILCYVLISVNKKKSNKLKIIIISSFFLFPFIINSIELFFYNVYVYILTFIKLQVYPGNALNSY